MEELSLIHSTVISHVTQVVLEPLMWNSFTHACSLMFLTAICKWTDPITERLSKTCYRSKFVLMMNVKTAYCLDISGKIEGNKGNKEAELVFQGYSLL